MEESRCATGRAGMLAEVKGSIGVQPMRRFEIKEKDSTKFWEIELRRGVGQLAASPGRVRLVHGLGRF